MNKPRIYKVLTALIILGGFFGILNSIPLNNIYTAIKQGGITVGDKVTVQYVQPDTPAAAADLEEGDTIVSVNNEKITSSADFIEISDKNQGKEITINIERNGNPQAKQLIPRMNPPANEGRVGVALANTGVEKKPVQELIPQTIIASYSISTLIALILGITTVVIGFGLWRLKKWAIYSLLFFSGLGFLLSLKNFVDYANSLASPFRLLETTTTSTTSIYLGTGVFLLIWFVQFLICFYFFKQRKILT